MGTGFRWRELCLVVRCRRVVDRSHFESLDRSRRISARVRRTFSNRATNSKAAKRVACGANRFAAGTVTATAFRGDSASRSNGATRSLSLEKNLFGQRISAVTDRRYSALFLAGARVVDLHRLLFLTAMVFVHVKHHVVVVGDLNLFANLRFHSGYGLNFARVS